MPRGASSAFGLNPKWSRKTRYVYRFLCLIHWWILCREHLLLYFPIVHYLTNAAYCIIFILFIASLATAHLAPGLVPTRPWPAPSIESQPDGAGPEQRRGGGLSLLLVGGGAQQVLSGIAGLFTANWVSRKLIVNIFIAYMSLTHCTCF